MSLETTNFITESELLPNIYDVKMPLIDKIPVQNYFTDRLPGDPIMENYPRQVSNACYSFVEPVIPKEPKLVHASLEVAESLGIDEITSDTFLKIVSGAKIFLGVKPFAMCYGGHQFGQWAGQLGDGRAINIGEVETKMGILAMQLKGAGKTPYSRGADGLAVLRSSIREYLMSEAMFHLGVPTTRALSIALSGESVLRDVLYNGNSAYEKGAIVCRIAPNFVRFGSFEIFAAKGDHVTLKKLTDYIISSFYNELDINSPTVYLDFFREVVRRTKEMIIHWQRVGFVHGVMNTDNMSILGLTIDYGPYGWLENFDPGWTPNTTDAQHKRYRFGNQPNVALWNLTQLANALFPLINDVDSLQGILDSFKNEYPKDQLKMMLSKIGVEVGQENDHHLIGELELCLRSTETDMTLFFRELSSFDSQNPASFLTIIQEVSYVHETIFNLKKLQWKKWLNDYAQRLCEISENPILRKKRMNSINPKYVLRNYMAQLAIDAADKNDYSILIELFKLLEKPYDEQLGMEKWYSKRPDWAREKIGCSMLSCSS